MVGGRGVPYVIRQKGSVWLTVNTETRKVKGTHQTKKLAEAQRRLLYGVESGWKPTGGKKQ